MGNSSSQKRKNKTKKSPEPIIVSEQIAKEEHKHIDVETTWNDETLCKQHILSIIDEIKSDMNPKNNLFIIEKYIDECLTELNDIKPPCYDPQNFGKAAESPPITQQSYDLIYEIITPLTEYLICIKPQKTSEFAINHYFQKVLILCKRCIELDIECFQLLEIIFGFVRQDANKATFYNVCGLPVTSDTIWDLTQYGLAEFSAKETLTHQKAFCFKLYLADDTERDIIVYFDETCPEMSHYNDYPLEQFTYCGDLRNFAIRNMSWFRIENVNFFGKIGGFITILQRIMHMKCPLDPPDLVNILRPIAQLRELWDGEYFQIYVHNIQNALYLYYNGLPDVVMQDFNYEVAEKSFRNLHYMMNTHFNAAIINEVKTKLVLSFSFRQFKLNRILLQIEAVNRINSLIDKWLNEEKSLSLLISIKMIRQWIEESGILSCMLYTTFHFSRLSSMFRLLQYDNDQLDVSKYVVPFVLLILENNNDAQLQVDVKELYFKYCQYLIAGYMKKFACKDIPNDICQMIFSFLCHLETNELLS